MPALILGVVIENIFKLNKQKLLNKVKNISYYLQWYPNHVLIFIVGITNDLKETKSHYKVPMWGLKDKVLSKDKFKVIEF